MKNHFSLLTVLLTIIISCPSKLQAQDRVVEVLIEIEIIMLILSILKK
jgi:hypothetical protein